MGTAFETAQKLNSEFADLYGSSIKEYVQLPAGATINQIKEIANTNSVIGYQHNIKVGEKCVIALRKYTWRGNVAKTSYLHIFHVKDFDTKTVITHWREQKNGTFKVM